MSHRFPTHPFNTVSLVLCLILALVGGLMAPSLFAADDPSIQGELREGIQKAMEAFIGQRTVDGVFRIYDPVSDEVRTLKLQELHSGIVKKGDFYVSCADFVDPQGDLVDLDLLVVEDYGELTAVQALVHKVDGQKRPYSLESQ